MSEHLKTTEPKLTYVPWQQAAERIRAHGGAARIWASNAPADVFWFTGVHPMALDRDQRLDVAICAPDGTLFAVTGISVGYNGDGPDWTRRLLLELGLAEDLAQRIAYSRVSAVDLENPAGALHTSLWPHFNLPVPHAYETVHGTVLRVTFDDDAVLKQDRPELTEEDRLEASNNGFYPAPHSTSRLRSWMGLLDSPQRPWWLEGTRTIELHTTYESAEEHGLVVPEKQHELKGGVYPMRMSQGQVQTWVTWPLFPSEYHDRGEVGRLPDVAREAFVLFGVDPNQVQRLDSATGVVDAMLHKVAGFKRRSFYRFTIES